MFETEGPSKYSFRPKNSDTGINRVISVDYGHEHLSPRDIEDLSQGIENGQTVIVAPKYSVMTINPSSKVGGEIYQFFHSLNGLILHDIRTMLAVRNLAKKATLFHR